MADMTQQQYQEWCERNDAFASGPQGKSRGVTALLAIFLGSLGIQYFYIGKPTGGIVLLIVFFFLNFLNLLTLGLLFFLCFIPWIITVIQGILILCMDNKTFADKYINTPTSFPLF